MPTQQTPLQILSLLQKIKILTVFRNHQEHEEHFQTLEFPETKIEPNWIEFFTILRDSNSNLHHRTEITAIPVQINH
jgi:hypothetical protein